MNHYVPYNTSYGYIIASDYFTVYGLPETNAYNAAMMNTDISLGTKQKKEPSDFGRRMADARRSAGITQVELAQMLGVNQRVVAAWERKNVALRAEQIRSLAESLNTSADYLIGISGSMSRKKGIRGPSGKVRQVFEQVAKLPRRQQDKVAEFVEAFVNFKIAAG